VFWESANETVKGEVVEGGQGRMEVLLMIKMGVLDAGGGVVFAVGRKGVSGVYGRMMMGEKGGKGGWRCTLR